MNFIMSYSCGKDSTLALHKLIEQGHQPVGLLVMVNRDLGRSWFHGADQLLLDRIADALGIPLILCPSKGADYHLALEKGLARGKSMGAEIAGFGDIDIDEHRDWCLQRCRSVGLTAAFPLWRQSRNKITCEIIETGYRCIIKSIDNNLLPKSLLGKELSAQTVKIMSERGIDICGENGEYHTIAVDGPIFKSPVDYRLGQVLDFDTISIIDIRA